MTETKWTPGPHEVVVGEYSTPTKIYGQYQSRPNQILCIIVGDSAEADANAQLYAAAPDLYAATDWMNEIAEKGFMCSFLHIPVSDVKDHEKFEIILTGKEIRALIDARLKARGGE